MTDLFKRTQQTCNLDEGPTKTIQFQAGTKSAYELQNGTD